MKRGYACLLAVALLAPSAARAQGSLPIPIPSVCGTPNPAAAFAFVVVNTTCVNLTPLITLDPVTGLFNLQARDLTVGTGLLNDVTATFKTDPFISFGANTSNLTGDETEYTFWFGTPIDPGYYSRATSTGSVSVTSGQAGSTTVAQHDGEEFINVYGSNGLMLTSLGVDIGTGTCTAEAASNTCRYPPPDGGPASNEFEPTFYDNLEVVLTYTQTDAGSQVGWTGRADLFLSPNQSVVPEPGTFVLVLGGLAVIAGGSAVRRRRLG